MTDPVDLLVTGATLATMVPRTGDPLGMIAGAAMAVAGGRVVAAGDENVVRASVRPGEVWDAGGRLVTPGLVDCHTHLVFGGDRRDEFARRAAGATYEELAAAGGGILSTVAATRAATEEDLLAGTIRRIGQLAAGGVTTVEVKSGYGLDVETELRMLRVAAAAGGALALRVVPTLLALHALPSEFAGRRDAYVDLVCEELLPAVAAAGLARSVDAFCDRIAFTAAEVGRLFTRARELGLRVKVHADQLSEAGAAALAAHHGALSADHLEHASAVSIAAMADAGTVAVLLPGATVTLHEEARPPVQLLRAAGVPMAVSTDANPGSSPLLSLLVAAHLACTVHGLTPAEAFAGITLNAAAALGLAGQVGVLTPGAHADFVAWDAEHPEDLVYWCGGYSPVAVAKAGKTRFTFAQT